MTTAEARAAIYDAMPRFGTGTVPIASAAGRVLREPVVAERDQPPFDRVMMDGIAIRMAGFEAGTRRFRISATQHAGEPNNALVDDGDCIEIMTGAMLPDGADTIVPVERIVVSDGFAELEPDYSPGAGQFVHRQGSDHRQGVEVLAEGTELSALDVAILASCGRETIDVAASPTVRVISTGTELVPPGATIEAHQIRMSNGPALVAMLVDQGFNDASHDHLVDEPELMETRIAEHLDSANVLILSGGVSMGKADFVPEILTRLGVELVFHKISQRPGKPMWFGMGPHGQAVFALPGNPVSALVCCRQYVLPALAHASGRPERAVMHALLDSPVTFKPRLTCFLPVMVRTDGDGRLLASPKPTNTSGDFTSLSGTDGYVELALEVSEFEAGLAVPFHSWTMP